MLEEKIPQEIIDYVTQLHADRKIQIDPKKVKMDAEYYEDGIEEEFECYGCYLNGKRNFGVIRYYYPLNKDYYWGLCLECGWLHWGHVIS